MTVSDRRLALVLLAVSLVFVSHCQKQDAPPPPPTAAPAQTGSDCCQLTPVAGLTEGLGRLVVAFPDGSAPRETRVAVLQAGQEAQSGYGSQSWELASGTYDVTISNKPVPGVTVKAGHETRIRVGVLHLNADQQTRIELLEPSSGEVLISGYGEKTYGLPIGPVGVQVAGQSETAMIDEGMVTEF